MSMKALCVAGALILATAGGTATAADGVPDSFSVLDGVEAEALSRTELDTVRGGAHTGSVEYLSPNRKDVLSGSVGYLEYPNLTFYLGE